MIVELKRNKSSKAAIEQIHMRNYLDVFNGYSGEILLVGINYDEEKGHSCKIEKVEKM